MKTLDQIINELDQQTDTAELTLVEKLQEAFKENVWSPDFITRIDSDPRYRTLDAIEEKTGIEIEWAWTDTDFSAIGKEPIVIEFSNGHDDKVKQGAGLKIVETLIGPKHIVIESSNLIIITEEK